MQFTVSFSAAGGGASVGLANTTFSYNPMTQGPILSITASVDKVLSTTAVGGVFTNTFHPLIEQDGNFYIGFIPGPTITPPGSTGYHTLSQAGLSGFNFLEYDFTTNSIVIAFPNFAGDPMLFGLAQIFSSTAGAASSAEADYDNLRLTVLNKVPEPASIFLLGAGIAGLAGLRRRTRA